MESKSSKMEIFIGESTKMINLKVKVNIYGKIHLNTKENLGKGKEAEKVFGSHQIKQMLKFTKESIIMTKKKDMEFIDGIVDHIIRVILRKTKSMGLGKHATKMVK